MESKHQWLQAMVDNSSPLRLARPVGDGTTPTPLTPPTRSKGLLDKICTAQLLLVQATDNPG